MGWFLLRVVDKWILNQLLQCAVKCLTHTSLNANWVCSAPQKFAKSWGENGLALKLVFVLILNNYFAHCKEKATNLLTGCQGDVKKLIIFGWLTFMISLFSPREAKTQKFWGFLPLLFRPCFDITRTSKREKRGRICTYIQVSVPNRNDSYPEKHCLTWGLHEKSTGTGSASLGSQRK